MDEKLKKINDELISARKKVRDLERRRKELEDEYYKTLPFQFDYGYYSQSKNGTYAIYVSRNKTYYKGILMNPYGKICGKKYYYDIMQTLEETLIKKGYTEVKDGN